MWLPLTIVSTLSIGLAACRVTVNPEAAPEPAPSSPPKADQKPAKPDAPSPTVTAAATASASTSGSAEPRLCGSRFPACPEGTTCSHPVRGTCEPTR